MPSATPQDPVWSRLVRFEAEDGNTYHGEPVDSEIDVGLAIAAKEPLLFKVLDAKSALDLGAKFTGEIKEAVSILTPLSPSEIGTIRCIGLNYTDHAAEMSLTIPTVPESFTKPTTSILSPGRPLILPSSAHSTTDPEVELAIVIGRDCKDVSVKHAPDHVLGYMVANDVTARHVQGLTSQWGYSKGFDGFCPLGPVLVSKREVPDPAALELRTVLNGSTMQDGRAENMIFGVAQCVSYLSVGTTLKAGTVILSGTPAGIGHGRKPPIYLKEGDDMRLWISHGLGTLINPIVQGPELKMNGIYPA